MRVLTAVPEDCSRDLVIRVPAHPLTMASSGSGLGLGGHHSVAQLALNPKPAKINSGTASSPMPFTSSPGPVRARAEQVAAMPLASDEAVSLHDSSSDFSLQGQRRPAKGSTTPGAVQSPADNPRALLDPKGYARRAINGGQPASEAPAMAAVRKAHGYLPSPEASEGSTPIGGVDGALHHDVGLPTMAGLIEKIHGVSEREQRPVKRQKREHSNDDDDEGRAKTSFAGGGRGGVIGEYMKQKKEEGKAEAAKSGSVVDLTAGEAGRVGGALGVLI